MSAFVRLLKDGWDRGQRDPLAKSLWRSAQYQAQDGGRELGQGVFLLGCALCCYLSFPGTWLMPWRCIFAFALLGCGVLAPPRVAAFVQRRFTWPRAGYADTRRGFSFSWPGTILILLTCVAVVAGIMCFTRPLVADAIQHNLIQPGLPGHAAITRAQKIWLSAFGGFSALLYLQVSAISFGRYRWKWLVWLFMALGPMVTVQLVPGNFMERVKPVLLLIALAWLASGGATLHAYIQNNQPPAPETAGTPNP